MYPDDHTLSLHGVCDVLEHIKWSDGKLIPWCAQYMYPTQKNNTNTATQQVTRVYYVDMLYLLSDGYLCLWHNSFTDDITT